MLAIKLPTIQIKPANELAWLVLSAIFLLFLYPNTGLDIWLSHIYYNTTTHHFPLKHHLFYESVMHTGLKNFVLMIAVIACLAATLIKSSSQFSPLRQPLFWVVIAMIISTSVVSYLRSISIHACPADLTMFGGNQPYLALFADLPIGIEKGQCFPSGHASGGFAIMAFFFAFRDSKPAIASISLYSGLTLGCMMGWVQIARGAHFLSHVLWSAWIVYGVLWLLYQYCPPNSIFSCVNHQS